MVISWNYHESTLSINIKKEIINYLFIPLTSETIINI